MNTHDMDEATIDRHGKGQYMLMDYFWLEVLRHELFPRYAVTAERYEEN